MVIFPQTSNSIHGENLVPAGTEGNGRRGRSVCQALAQTLPPAAFINSAAGGPIGFGISVIKYRVLIQKSKSVFPGDCDRDLLVWYRSSVSPGRLACANHMGRSILTTTPFPIYYQSFHRILGLYQKSGSKSRASSPGPLSPAQRYQTWEPGLFMSDDLPLQWLDAGAGVKAAV